MAPGVSRRPDQGRRLRSHGSFLRVPALGAGFHESGIGMADGTDRGHLDSFTDEAKAQLCALLVP